MFAAGREVRANADFRQPLVDLTERFGQVDVTFRGTRRHEIVEFRVALRIQRSKRKILELLANFLHTQSMRERCIDVEGLLGDTTLFLERCRCDRAHVVQSVSQLDDQNTQVLGHRDQHLAHRRCLLCLARVELQSLQLGQTIDDRGDLRAEVRLDVGEGDFRVLDRIVQQRSSQ